MRIFQVPPGCEGVHRVDVEEMPKAYVIRKRSECKDLDILEVFPFHQ